MDKNSIDIPSLNMAFKFFFKNNYFQNDFDKSLKFAKPSVS